MIYFLLFINIFVQEAKAANDIDTEVVKASIMYVERSLKEEDAQIIADALTTYAYAYELDWKIMAAIIAQESSFRRDPGKCTTHTCRDLGICQINARTWIKPLKLNKTKLITNVNYNIETMAKILRRLKNKYGKEHHWYTRYHSFTRMHRNIYEDLIFHKYLRISSYAKGYEDSPKKGKYVSIW